MKPTLAYIRLTIAGLMQETGIKIVAGKGWASDIKKKILYYNQREIENAPFEVIRGLFLHEMAHLLYSRPTIMPTAYQKKYGKDLIFNLYNAFEDNRIEDQINHKYGKFSQSALKETHLYGIETVLNSYNGNLTTFPLTDQFLYIAYAYYLAGRIQALNTASYSGASLLDFRQYGRSDPFLYISGYGSFFITVDNRVVERISKNRALILKCFDTVRTLSTTDDVIRLVDKRIIPIILDFLEEDKKKKQSPQPHRIKIPFGKRTTTDTGNMKMKATLPSKQEVKNLLRPYIFTLSHRIKDILNEKYAKRFTGHLKRGKLLSKNAYKVMTDEERIFSRKTNPDTPKYNLFLGLDASGSMGDGKRNLYAYMGACLLEAVSESLDFNFYPYAYDSNAKPLLNIENYNAIGGGTNDHSFFQAVRNEIKKQPTEQDNIIFIITDGTSYKYSGFDETIADLEKRGSTVWGIGIGDRNIERGIKRIYKNSVYVQNVEQLPKELVATMRNTIKR